jgi:hypothetical protein
MAMAKSGRQIEREIAARDTRHLRSVGQDPRSLASYARQAITTKYAGPTDSSGARVIAKCEAKKIIVPWDHALGAPENHAAAALELMGRLGWAASNDLVMGGTADGFVFVQVPRGR